MNRDLIRVPVAEWGGMIFVRAQVGNGRIDVPAYLGDFSDVLAVMDLPNAYPAKKGRVDGNANWKYALDTYGETYHFNMVHSQSVGLNFFGDANTFSQHGRHHTFAFAGRDFATIVGKDESEWTDVSMAQIFYIFPNVIINFYPMPNAGGMVNIHRIFPGETVDQFFAVLDSYKWGNDVTPEDLPLYEQVHEAMMHVVRGEDFVVAANARQNMQHMPDGFMALFGRNEQGAQNVQKEIAAAIGMPL